MVPPVIGNTPTPSGQEPAARTPDSDADGFAAGMLVALKVSIAALNARLAELTLELTRQYDANPLGNLRWSMIAEAVDIVDAEYRNTLALYKSKQAKRSN